MVGRSVLDLDDLNATLEDAGYANVDDSFISFGGAGYGIVGRVIVGGEGQALAGDDATSGSYVTSIEAGYGLFDLGYLLVSSGGLNLYPMIGVGAGGMSLRIRERGEPSFDEVLADPRRGSELSNWGLLVSLDLGADYLVVLGEDNEGAGGIALGVRVGYTFAPYTSEWSLEDTEIPEGPDVGITGPHVRLMIGGGGTVSK